jgi:hypothetical protein
MLHNITLYPENENDLITAETCNLSVIGTLQLVMLEHNTVIFIFNITHLLHEAEKILFTKN